MDKHERKEIYGYENIKRKGIEIIILIVLVVLPFLEMVPNGSVKGCLYPMAKDCLFCYIRKLMEKNPWDRK